MRTRRWRFILNLISGLPTHSRYMAAVADDEEVAAQILEQPEQPARPPSLTDFDPTTRALGEIYDRLGTLVSVSIAATGKKPPRMQPFRRPRLAIDRLRERRRMAKHRALVTRLKSGQSDPPT